MALLSSGPMALPNAGGLGVSFQKSVIGPLLSFGAHDSKSSEGPTDAVSPSASSSTSPVSKQGEGAAVSETWTPGENLLKKMRQKDGSTPADFVAKINETLPSGSPSVQEEALSQMEDGSGPIDPLIAQYLVNAAREKGINVVKEQMDRRGWTSRQLSFFLSASRPESEPRVSDGSVLRIIKGRTAIPPRIAATIYELATYGTVKFHRYEKYGPAAFGVTRELLDEMMKQHDLTADQLRLKLKSRSRKKGSTTTINSINKMRQGRTNISTEVARIVRELANSSEPKKWVPPTSSQLEATKHITAKDLRQEQKRRRLFDEVILDDLNEQAPEGVKTTLHAYRHMRNGDSVVLPWVAELFEKMSKSPSVHIRAIQGPPFYGITPKHLKYQMKKLTEEKLIDWLNSNRPEGIKPLNKNLLYLLTYPSDYLPADQVALSRHQIPQWMAKLLYQKMTSGPLPPARRSEMVPVTSTWMNNLAKVMKRRQWRDADMVAELNNRRAFDTRPVTLPHFLFMKWERRFPSWIQATVRKMAKEKNPALTGEGLQKIDGFFKASEEFPNDMLPTILEDASWKRHAPGTPLTPQMLNRLFEKKQLSFQIWQTLVDAVRPMGVSAETLKKVAAAPTT